MTMGMHQSRFRPYVRTETVGPDGLPQEHFSDRYTRSDELMIEVLKELRKVAAGIGGIVIPDNPPSNGGVITPESERIKNLRITTLPMPTADTEYPYQFATGTKAFLMHARNGNEIRMSTQQGIVAMDPATESKDPRFTLKANTSYNQDDLNIRDFTQTFYFACSVASEVLEIIIGV